MPTMALRTPQIISPIPGNKTARRTSMTGEPASGLPDSESSGPICGSTRLDSDGGCEDGCEGEGGKTTGGAVSTGGVAEDEEPGGIARIGVRKITLHNGH